MSSKNDKTSIENNVKLLNEIAGKYGKRTTSDNLIDPQVRRIPYDWKDVFSDKDKPIPPDRFIRKVSYQVDDFKIMLCINDEYLVARIEGAFDNSVICSFVNNQVNDPGKPVSKALCKDYGFKVFVNSSYEESTISFLQNPSFKNYINLLFAFRQRKVFTSAMGGRVYIYNGSSAMMSWILLTSSIRFYL